MKSEMLIFSTYVGLSPIQMERIEEHDIKVIGIFSLYLFVLLSLL